MAELSQKLLFYIFSLCAYLSPSLMIISLSTDYWLFCYEKIPTEYLITRTATSRTLTTSQFPGELRHFMNKTAISTFIHIEHIDPTRQQYRHVETNFGLLRMCTTIDEEPEITLCDPLRYFDHGDSRNNPRDILKYEIVNCTLPLVIALMIMAIGTMLHTYALFRNHSALFIISGCMFLTSGLATLTGLVVFIAVINDSMDNKLLKFKTKEDEPMFKYTYGVSFVCALSSFVFQKLNGICNIYWYIGYYRNYQYQTDFLNGQTNQLDNAKTTKVRHNNSIYLSSFHSHTAPSLNERDRHKKSMRKVKFSSDLIIDQQIQDASVSLNSDDFIVEKPNYVYLYKNMLAEKEGLIKQITAV